MGQTIRWGILGTAHFALGTMGPAIHNSRNAVLAAVATRSREKAAPFLEFAPEMRVHHSYDAMLVDPEIDAIYIPLPNSMHVDWSRKAAEAGKHVLCEKPIALKSSEIDGLIATRDATGCLIAEAYMIPHHPQWQRMREMVQGGEIGELLHIDSYFTFNQTNLRDIRFNPEMGGGVLPDIGVYTLGSARLATGAEPTDFCARLGWKYGVDVTAQIWANFGATTCSIYMSMEAPERQYVSYHGTKGTIELQAPFNPVVYKEAQIRITRPGWSEEVVRMPRDRQYINQVEAFGRTITTGAAYPVPLEFSRGTQDTLEAVYGADQNAP